MNGHFRLLAVAMMLAGAPSAWAQGDAHAGHTPAAAMEQKEQSAPPAMDHSARGSSAMPAPSDLRDPHAYSGGYDFSQFPMRHEDHGIPYRLLRVDRFEVVHAGRDTFATYDLQGAYGSNFDHVVVKAEGDIDKREVKEASTELLWSHAVASFWNSQLGLRQDSGEGPNRSWIAAGLQGLAPYWFELDATAYLGEQGRTALNIEAEYELLLTQKWILQPRFEVDFFGKKDTARAIGSGLADFAIGVRLRYEIRREIAPYLGVEWAAKFGDTADYARDTGEKTDETRWVAGIRFWL